MKKGRITALFVLLIFSTWISILNANTNKYFLITHGSADYYWVEIFDGAKEAAKDIGLKLQISAPPGAIDVSAQLRMLESALSTKPAGIATTCPSETVFSSVLQKAEKMGIPLIIFDSKPKDKKNNPYDAFIGSDTYKQGLVVAEKALSLGRVKNRALIAIPQAGNAAIDNRKNAITKVLEKNNIKVSSLLTGTDPSRVQMLVKAFLIKHPDTSAIFSLTSQSLIPIGELLRRGVGELKTKPVVFSFDNTPETSILIKNGIVDFALDQQQFLMGYYAVTEMYLKNKFNYKPVDIDTGYRFISRDI